MNPQDTHIEDGILDGWLGELASIVLRDIDINRCARPYLPHLALTGGATINLALIADDHVVYLQVAESPQLVKIQRLSLARLG